MRTFIRSGLTRITLGSIALCATTAVWAVPISSGTWYEFGFFGPGGAIAFQGTGTLALTGTMPAGAPGWTFVGAAEIALTDNFSQGDSFSLFDNDIFVGSTPSVSKGIAGVSGIDPENALLDPSYSHGIFSLGPGEHRLTIRVDNDPFWAGAGFFKIIQPPDPDGASANSSQTTESSVPDGGSHLLLIGLGAVALFRRFLCLGRA